MTNQAPRTTIVIPARNEAVRLPPSIPRLRTELPEGEFDFLVVVEPGTDRTADLARAAVDGDSRFCIHECPTAKGKGAAVKVGMLAAQGDWIFFMDADLSVPPSTVRFFLTHSPRADVLIGSRRHPHSRIPVRQPLAREVFGRVFNWCLRLTGATQFHDTQCGFKAFRREAARRIFSQVQLTGFGFDVEVLALADAMGFRTLELPVEWHDAPGSKLSPLRDGFRSLVESVLAARRVRRQYR